MAKRKQKEAQAIEPQAQEAKQVEQVLETDSSTQKEATFQQLIDELVCRLRSIAVRDTQKQMIDKIEKLLPKYECNSVHSAVQCCLIELDSPQPVEIKWGVVANIIKDATAQATKEHQ